MFFINFTFALLLQLGKLYGSDGTKIYELLGVSVSPMIIGSVIDNSGIMQGYALTAGSDVIAMVLVIVANKLVKNQKSANNEQMYECKKNLTSDTV